MLGAPESRGPLLSANVYYTGWGDPKVPGYNKLTPGDGRVSEDRSLSSVKVEKKEEFCWERERRGEREREPGIAGDMEHMMQEQGSPRG